MFRAFYKRHCHSALWRPFVGIGRSMHRYYENLNYDHETNGEGRVLEILSQYSVKTVFDVGANIGSWTAAAKPLFPTAKFYCFEAIPETCELLKKNLPEGATAFSFALGAKPDQATFYHYKNGSALSSGYRFEGHREKPVEVRVRTVAGDDFLKEQNIPRVDLLKIDTEGFDLEVLKGFSQALSEKRIGTVQFEYGKINIISKSLLRDFYEFLRPFGYSIGKIYPKSVKFEDYSFEKEDFIGPNFLAVPSTETTLIRSLS